MPADQSDQTIVTPVSRDLVPAKRSGWPAIAPLDLATLAEVIGKGVDDFRRTPGYSVSIALLFAAGGWLIVACVWLLGLPYLAYPLAMGFALVAPLLAAGFYAISELLERHEAVTWPAIYGGISRAFGRDLRWMALVTGFALFLWLDIAIFTTLAFGGLDVLSMDFIDKLLTTPSGLAFLVIGNTAGAIIALGVFSLAAVSFPMLYDRDVDFVTAMVTSVRVVLNNPVPMIAWCAFIGIAMALSILSAFLGLLVFLPVIGHATWHLYRRAVAPAPAAAGQ